MQHTFTFRIFTFFLCLVSLGLAGQGNYHIPAHATVNDYEQGVVYFRLKEQYRSLESNPLSDSRLHTIYQAVGGTDVRKSFPNAKNPQGKRNAWGEPFEDLSMIYVMHFSTNYQVAHVMKLLQKTGMVEYAQPRFFVKPLFTPNDPQLAQQYYLNLIKAYQAWDITFGDTNICIGIVDGGIQFTHQDLMANVKFNYNDPINGIDDDGDGYVDNFRGWNFGNNTNDPTASLSPHGVFVSGIASATPHNNVGIAGVGFHTKYLPIRIDNAQGWGFGYEGIVYSADMGCQVINASWGNTFYSPMNESVVRYATINKNALVIGAAGNSNQNEKFYPASYEYAISVTATNQTDTKWVNATFSVSTDLAAPGENIRSTWPFNGYDNSSGTSFAAPQVSAAAALLKAHKPAYNAIQLGERLKVTADSSIYQVPGNANFYHRLGSGRLNIHRALTDPDRPSIVAKNILINGLANEKIAAGTQASITADFINYLEPASNLSIRLVSESPHFTVISPAIQVGALGMMQTFSNSSQAFIVEVATDAPMNVFAELKFVFEANDYFGFQYFRIDANLDYMDLAVNNISTTITSKGDLGYNQPYQMFGEGFRWNNSNSLLDYSGLMIGDSPTRVSNNAYSNTIPQYDRHFNPVDIVALVEDTDAAREIQASFNDELAQAQQLPVLVKQKAYAFDHDNNRDYIIQEFTIINSGNQTLQNVFAGNFTDWTIGNYQQNQARFIPEAKMAYAFSNNPQQPFTAVKVLSAGGANSYCINADGLSGSINYYNGFSNVEKYQTLTGADQRHETVMGDVATVVSQGPFTIEAGDSVMIAFAFIAGQSLEELFASANQATANYLFRETDADILATPKGCNGELGDISILFNSGEVTHVDLLNESGELIASEELFETITFYDLEQGNYQLRFIYNDSVSISIPVTIDALPSVTATVEASATTLFLPDANITLTASATNAEFFQWIINGGETFGEMLNLSLSDTGNFEVKMIAYNASCADTVLINITVLDTTTTSLPHIVSDGMIQIFPNPSRDLIHIQTNETIQNASMAMIDLSGRILYRLNLVSNVTQLSLADLPEGVYFLQLNYGDKQFIRKIMKQ
ncbi:MAG: S8 family peptidase [Flavobacteriales bacterium]